MTRYSVMFPLVGSGRFQEKVAEVLEVRTFCRLVGAEGTAGVKREVGRIILDAVFLDFLSNW